MKSGVWLAIGVADKITQLKVRTVSHGVRCEGSCVLLVDGRIPSQWRRWRALGDYPLMVPFIPRHSVSSHSANFNLRVFHQLSASAPVHTGMLHYAGLAQKQWACSWTIDITSYYRLTFPQSAS